MRDLLIRTTMRRMGIEVPPPQGEQALDGLSSTFECFMGPGVPRGREQETWKGEVVGPETEEERRIRLTKEEAMLAHTPMEVCKSFYKRNKREIVKR